MGLVRNWIKEMGDVWKRMGQGEPEAFLGLPRKGQGTGSGHGSAPDGQVLSALQRKELNQFFHQQYGRYPLTDFEFQQWLNANW